VHCVEEPLAGGNMGRRHVQVTRSFGRAAHGLPRCTGCSPTSVPRLPRGAGAESPQRDRREVLEFLQGRRSALSDAWLGLARDRSRIVRRVVAPIDEKAIELAKPELADHAQACRRDATYVRTVLLCATDH
jgi:hypothetical protein